jgi:hypothetical protein
MTLVIKTHQNNNNEKHIIFFEEEPGPVNLFLREGPVLLLLFLLLKKTF